MTTVRGGLHTLSCRDCTRRDNEQVASVNHIEKMRRDYVTSVGHITRADAF